MATLSTDLFEYLDAHASRNPGQVFLSDGAQQISYKTALEYVQRMAFQLRQLGLTSGQTVSIDLPSTLGILFLLAAFHESLVVSFDFGRAANQLSIKRDWLITNKSTSSEIATKTILIDSEFLREVNQNPIGVLRSNVSGPDSICAIHYSSGTTGQPKAIAYSKAMLFERSQSAAQFWMDSTPFMSLLNTGAASGLFTFCATLISGGTYLVPGDAENNVKQINSNKIRVIKASPIQVSEMLEYCKKYSISMPTLEIIRSAGSPLPTELAAELRTHLNVGVHNLYGSSEAGTACIRNYETDNMLDIGFPSPGTELQIVDSEGKLVATGDVGIVRYRRPAMALAYMSDAEASNNSFKDGWFYPGDLGHFGDQGNIILDGRTDSLINAGGVKIDPEKAEIFARTLIGVEDAIGFSVVNKAGLSEFAIGILPRKNFDTANFIKEITQILGSSAPTMVVLVDQIPRGAMGKPLRGEMSSRFAEQNKPI